MAPNVTASFWEPGDINGTPLLTIDDEDTYFKGLKLQLDLYGVGGWELTLARSLGFALFSSGAVSPEVFVRFMVHAYSDEQWYFGGLINKRLLDVVQRDELGAEEFVTGGPGPKAYLERYRLGIEQNVSSEWNLDLTGGVWRWAADAPAGKILRKVIDEDAAADPQALVDLDVSFSRTSDSDGVTWVNDIAGNETYEHPIGSSLLEIMWDLEDLSDLFTTVDLGTEDTPAFLLNAYQTFGDDVTGTSFGAGVGLFREGVNIANESLTVEGVSLRRATHVIVEGKDGAWATQAATSWSPGDYVKWAKIEYPRSGSVAVLERAGLRWIRRQENGDKQITVEILPGASEATGLYFPSPSSVIWLGNTVTLDTTADGSTHTPLDYENADQLLTAIELELGPAGSDASADAIAKSWDIKVKLNTERAGFSGSPNQSSASTSPGNGGGGGCNCPKLCHPITPDIPGQDEELTTIKFYRANDAGGDAINWTGNLANQGGTPGQGANGSSWYNFKSTSPNQYQDTWAASAGSVYQISGWVNTSSAGQLQFAYTDLAAGSAGSSVPGATLYDTRLITPPQPNTGTTWIPFSAGPFTAPVGTTSAALGRTNGISFDEVTISRVDVPGIPDTPGDPGDTPAPVGTEGDPGTGGSAARCDHVHAIGDIALDDLSDVNAPSPDDLDVLTFDSGSGEWIAAPAGGGDAFWAPPTVVDTASAFSAGTTSLAVTTVAYPVGSNLIAIVSSTARKSNSITQTNVTWTERYTGNGTSQHVTIYTGVVAGSASATTATVALTGSNQTQCDIYRVTSAASNFTAAASVVTTSSNTVVSSTSATTLTVGNYYIVATCAAAPASSYTIASQMYAPTNPFGGQGRNGILRANSTRLAYNTVQSSGVSFFSAIVEIT